MSVSDLSLFLSFVIHGLTALRKYLADREVRLAFARLSTSQTDADKQAVASDIARLIYKPRTL